MDTSGSGNRGDISAGGHDLQRVSPVTGEGVPGLRSEEPLVQISRRRFVKFVGGALSLAGLPACTRPLERILPFVDQPPEQQPGVPTWYATAMPLDGFGTGLLVESREGRPIKIEGNPRHPASLGAAGIYEQAAVLSLYDADRLTTPLSARRPSTWSAFLAVAHPDALTARVGRRGAGLRLLLEPTSSPTDARLLDRVRDRYPDAGIHFHAPAHPPDESAPGLVRQVDFSAARVILAVNADFLARGPFHLRYARQFAAGREPGPGLNRLYAMESILTVTGAAADHRFAVRPSEMPRLLGFLLDAVQGRPVPGAPEWIAPVSHDLAGARGAVLCIAGDDEPADVHVLVDELNRVLGAVGTTTWFTRSPLYGAGDPAHGLSPLVTAMQGGDVEVIVAAAPNPCYATPGAMDFTSAWERVPERWYATSHRDETAERSTWSVPLTHFLEDWGDVRARDGTLAIIQPLIRPLYEGRSMTSLLAALLGEPAGAHELVRSTFGELGVGDDTAWSRALQEGVVRNTAAARVSAPNVALTARATAATSAPQPAPGVGAAPAERMTVEVVVRPDDAVYDGRFANNAWLQELPRPLTTLTWGNAAQVAPVTAEALGVSDGDVVRLEVEGRALELPAQVVPGVAAATVGLVTGFGRRAGGHVAAHVGVDVYPFLSGATSRAGVLLRPTGRRQPLALTQEHWRMEGRGIARAITAGVADLPREPDEPRPRALHEPRSVGGGPSVAQWAMTIDLSRCTGCSACVVACQAENNVPSVGREGVRDRREMHWLRIDRYAAGATLISQPMLCQHCEKAPCEYVCPVAATTHSPDGLNEMTYNRCVGTRFCSNNCPYKVRRFNWFDYNGELAETERLARNPDVTVRERGVMEKCTFCVQRIREADIAARVAGEPAGSRDVVTACQQACPSQAIVFGSLTDPDHAVALRREDPRAYNVLDELGTRPRVRYLARVRNPNEAITAP